MEVGTVLSAAQTLLTLLDSQKLKELCSFFGYKSKLASLQDTVSTISAVLCDAETKQHLSAQEQKLIEDLKGAVYEADDLLDEFVTLVERKKLLDTCKKMHLLSFFRKAGIGFKMSQEIKKIKKRLDAIAKYSKFSFKLDPEPIRRRRPETCSYIDAGGIIGRDGDLEKIVGMLLESHIDVQRNVSFLSIVGIGGLGKTALAQLVYNDPRVTSVFPLRLWICVSDQDKKEFNVKEILCKILTLVTSDKHEDSSVEEIQIKLRQKLANKKFLLVFDDVWTEKRAQWDDLAKYLNGGERGSWMVVTTRSKRTATIIGDGVMYGLQGLSAESSWHLFEISAFGSQKSNTPNEVVKIGREVVDVCAGVPLAIKVVGSFLYGQDESKWRSFQKIGLANIRESENDIMFILKLSYHHLVSPLKSCFCYCALFPKDFEIKKDVLISLWMAQGYIVPLDKGQSIEAAGEEYFSILLKRCFFQDVHKDKYGEIFSCKIHDLMHDLAQNVSNKEINATNTLCGEVDEKVRHVSIASRVYDTYSLGNTHIRSFFTVYNHSRMDILFLEPLLAHCKHLRALHLEELGIKSLPDSIGKLLHLRYLSLSWNRSLEMLPKSFTNLYCLETLNFNNCENLKELPTDLSKLAKLRNLNIRGCDRLLHMPRDMGKLTCLHTLSNFKVGGGRSGSSWKQWYDEFENLKALNNLKGCLDINIMWPKNASGCVRGSRKEGLYLNKKEHVNFIKFTFTNEKSGGRVDNEEARRLIEELQPHYSLKWLEVLGYSGTRMPGWITRLSNLVQLSISECRELEYLPGLGSLRHLRGILLRNLDKLEYVEDSLSAISYPALANAERLSYYSSLQTLQLEELPNMKGWRSKAQLQLLPCFPQLKSLCLRNCPELTCLPQCPRLADLVLMNFNKRLWQDPEIWRNSSLFPTLREVKIIDNVTWLNMLPIETFKGLEYLYILRDT